MPAEAVAGLAVVTVATTLQQGLRCKAAQCCVQSPSRPWLGKSCHGVISRAGCHSLIVSAGVTCIKQRSAALYQEAWQQQTVRRGTCTYPSEPYLWLCHAAALTGRSLCSAPAAASDSPTDRHTVCLTGSFSPTAGIIPCWEAMAQQQATKAVQDKRRQPQEKQQHRHC